MKQVVIKRFIKQEGFAGFYGSSIYDLSDYYLGLPRVDNRDLKIMNSLFEKIIDKDYIKY